MTSEQYKLVFFIMPNVNFFVTDTFNSPLEVLNMVYSSNISVVTIIVQPDI